ncbi:Putative ankyrin repeat protein [Cladobotryum mycophilum]|uniref:Ankyrin repeat protein n=1 Tax=Cladobotryum mycophilum TaxID=491253 RepID=A0ABR0SJH1_9HYPO
MEKKTQRMIERTAAICRENSMLSRLTGKIHEITSVEVWYCHLCAGGPWLKSSTSSCVECNHHRCIFCTVNDESESLSSGESSRYPAGLGSVPLTSTIPTKDKYLADMLENSGSVTKDLHEAISSNDFATVHKIWPSVNFAQQSLNGITALVHSIQLRRSSIAIFLIQNGASMKHIPGQSVLHLSIEHGLPDVAMSLVDNGADINGPDYLGRTALHLAAKTASGPLIRQLMRSGADDSVKDNEGFDPLFYAVCSQLVLSQDQITEDVEAWEPTMTFLYFSTANTMRAIRYLLLFNIDRLLLLDSSSLKLQKSHTSHFLQFVLDLREYINTDDSRCEIVVYHLLELTWNNNPTTEGRVRSIHQFTKMASEINVLDSSIDDNPSLDSVVQLQWEIPAVMKDMQNTLDADSTKMFRIDAISKMLSDFFIITGDAEAYECTTCGRFVEKEWRDIGHLALNVVAGALNSLWTSGPADKFSSINLWQVTSTSFTINLPYEHEHKKDILDAMAWLCAAIRLNPDNSKLKSTPTKPHLSRNIRKLSLKSMCWTRLFGSVVIAEYSIQREWGRGLELPFSMMVQLAAVENYCRFNQGIVMLGYLTALVPISSDPENKSIQWHFESTEEPTADCLRLENLDATKSENWFKAETTSIFEHTKCFVGWFEQANILLGTSRLLQHDKMNWSIDTDNQEDTFTRTGINANGQLTATIWPANFSAGVEQSWEKRSFTQYFERSLQYTQALSMNVNKAILLIDSGSKRAWLVPYLSLLLHLCHIYSKERRLFTEDVENHIPFAHPSSHGSQEAFRALNYHGHISVTGSGANTEHLSQLVQRIDTNFYNTRQTRKVPDGNYIYASELLDLVFEPNSESPLKKIKTSENSRSWQRLAEEAYAVVVCSDIGSAIEPVQQDCDHAYGPKCSELPEGRYYLAAHMKCLIGLLRLGGNTKEDVQRGHWKLGKKVTWKTSGTSLWADCGQNGHRSIWQDGSGANILQQIICRDGFITNIFQQIIGKNKGKGVWPANSASMEYPPESGVVVFGAPMSATDTNHRMDTPQANDTAPHKAQDKGNGIFDQGVSTFTALQRYFTERATAP